jgi:hypothetical protein
MRINFDLSLGVPMSRHTGDALRAVLRRNQALRVLPIPVECDD